MLLSKMENLEAKISFWDPNNKRIKIIETFLINKLNQPLILNHIFSNNNAYLEILKK